MTEDINQWVASPMPASWNQIAGWLKQIDGLRPEHLPVSQRSRTQVTAETAKTLKDLAEISGRAPGDLVEEAQAGYLEEVVSVRKTLDGRYDDLTSGGVKPIDGEEASRKRRDTSGRRRSGG